MGAHHQGEWCGAGGSVEHPYHTIRSRPLKAKHNSGGWLGNLRPTVCVQAGKIEARYLVHQSAIFGLQREMPRESVLCSHSVYERGFGFQRCTRESATGVASWIKQKGSGSGQRIRLKSGETRQFHHSGSSDLMDVSLDAGRCPTELELCVAIVTVVRLGCEP